MAARLATNMFNSLKGRPVQVSQKYFRFLLSLAYNVKTAWFFLCVCVCMCRVAYFRGKSHHNLLPSFSLWWFLRYSSSVITWINIWSKILSSIFFF